MKTINDLVERLNNYEAYGEYYIKKGKNDNYLLYKWFDEPEKKYNIIIGKNEREKIKTAYQKLHDGTYIADSVEEYDLKKDRYIFTESEIEELKSTLPTNMAKIVDLGKVEVKDD